FTFTLGRVDHGWDVNEEGRAAIPRPPSRYLRNLYVDTLTHSAPALRFILDMLGDERVVLGSDYPFRMGARDPIAALTPLALTGPTRERLLSGNARAFLGLGST